MSRLVALVLVAGLAACANGGAHNNDAAGGGDARHNDAREHEDGERGSDGSGSDAMPMGPSHVLLSEVCLGPDGAEFVELVNPTTSAVDLSHYYLSNHGSYFKLPAGAPTLPQDHFIVQFPAGASIAPAGIITVAMLSASSFQSAYGVMPTYSITDGTMTNTDLNLTPHLTDSGAFVVLFQWDGSTALVRDVDMMFAGTVQSPNTLISKSGYTQMGVSYAADANTIPQTQPTPALGKSTKRIALEGSHETQAGVGNGITGHDETSEATNLTWDQTFSNPTPNAAPAAIL